MAVKTQQMMDLIDKMRQTIPDLDAEQFEIVKRNFKEQRDVYRGRAIERIRKTVKVGDKVQIENEYDNHYTVDKVYRTRLDGKHSVTGQMYNFPFAMIIKIL
jgi:hypothetical protein